MRVVLPWYVTVTSTQTMPSPFESHQIPVLTGVRLSYTANPVSVAPAGNPAATRAAWTSDSGSHSPPALVTGMVLVFASVTAASSAPSA